jgi:hypothetical protein
MGPFLLTRSVHFLARRYLAQFVSAIDRPTAGYEAGRTDWYEAGYNKGYDEGFQMGLEAKTPPEPEPPPEWPSQPESTPKSEP